MDDQIYDDYSYLERLIEATDNVEKLQAAIRSVFLIVKKNMASGDPLKMRIEEALTRGLE